jgi:predicted peptidase
MKNYIHFLFITILCLPLLIGCNKKDEGFENTRSLQDVINDFAQLEFNEGINDISMEGPFSSTVWRFRVIIPEGTSALNKRPLVVCLHGGATIPGSDFHTFTDCLEEPGLINLTPILLCPNSGGGIWYNIPEQEEKVLTLTNLVKQNLPVDLNKVAVMGYSDGGNGAWFYAQYYPNEFSAAIALSSSYNPVRPDNIPVMIDIPIYVIHGENDQLFPLELTQSYINTSIEAGTDIEFVIAEGLEHYNSCSYVPYLLDAATWLQTTVWD